MCCWLNGVVWIFDVWGEIEEGEKEMKDAFENPRNETRINLKKQTKLHGNFGFSAQTFFKKALKSERIGRRILRDIFEGL